MEKHTQCVAHISEVEALQDQHSRSTRRYFRFEWCRLLRVRVRERERSKVMSSGSGLPRVKATDSKAIVRKSQAVPALAISKMMLV